MWLRLQMWMRREEDDYLCSAYCLEPLEAAMTNRRTYQHRRESCVCGGAQCFLR